MNRLQRLIWAALADPAFSLDAYPLTDAERLSVERWLANQERVKNQSKPLAYYWRPMVPEVVR